MSTAQFLPRNRTFYSIKAGRFEDRDFCFEAEIVYQKPNWDITLLHVKGINNCNFVKFAMDGSIYALQRVFHTGCSLHLPWSFMSGSVAYPCTDDVDIPMDNQVCLTYRSHALFITPRYRTMGDIWNVDVFRKFRANISFFYEKSLHPLVPVIQIHGLAEICSGGSVVNGEGEIVGMGAVKSGGFHFALHLSVLKYVLKEYEDLLGNGNRMRKDVADSSKKVEEPPTDPKGKGKR